MVNNTQTPEVSKLLRAARVLVWSAAPVFWTGAVTSYIHQVPALPHRILAAAVAGLVPMLLLLVVAWFLTAFDADTQKQAATVSPSPYAPNVEAQLQAFRERVQRGELPVPRSDEIDNETGLPTVRYWARVHPSNRGVSR